MKILHIACVSAVLTLGPLAFATLPVPSGVLGKVEGALDFCASADAKSADKYQEKKKEFAKGATADELADARASQDYKDGYQSANDELSRQSKEEVKKTCAAALAGK
ncbi:MAG TPA: hypothetical protein VK466_11380 [Terriglobales bacterium]|nr:hypothetical protein [Terriglobales bacterium]